MHERQRVLSEDNGGTPEETQALFLSPTVSRACAEMPLIGSVGMYLRWPRTQRLSLIGSAFTFGLFAILRPDKLRNAMDNFANAWKQDSWHPYQMPLPILRLALAALELVVLPCSFTSLTPPSVDSCCNIAIALIDLTLANKSAHLCYRLTNQIRLIAFGGG